MPPTAADALDRLAVWEPTGLSPLEDVVGRDQLELLDRAGLLTVRADGRRQTVTFAHPLYGEILRARMPALVRRRLLLEHADCLDAHGARRREDPLRAATARLEVSGSAELGLLVRAARLARYGQDFTQVERLGRAALRHGMTPEVGLLVGEALHELGSFAEADEVLTAAEASVTDADQLLVHITEIRSRNLVWGLFRGDEALAVNRSARDRLGDGPGVEELTLNEASLLSYCGRPLDALALLEPMPPTADRRARALRAMAEVPALVATGRCATGAATAVRAYAEQMELPDQIALPGPDVHIGNQIHALTECGRLNDAAALATAAYEATPSTAPPDALVWLSHQLGRCALLSGRVETARRWLGESLARCDAHNIIGPSRLVLSALATAHASLGDAALRRPQCSSWIGARRSCSARPSRSWVEPGGWSRWVTCPGPGMCCARQRSLRPRADIGSQRRGSSTMSRVSVTRPPSPIASASLRRFAKESSSPSYAAHAAAATAGRPEALVVVTDHFERIGARLLAAESASEAAQAFRSEGQGRAAAALGVRAATLAEACEGARTPGLIVPVMVVPLTARERDIATSAAQGESSKAIAERLFLSVRTVNNHLQNVYSKLGVTGRGQLADALVADRRQLGGGACIAPVIIVSAVRL